LPLFLKNRGEALEKLTETISESKPESLLKEVFICPVCNCEVDENIKDYHRNLEEWAINEILEANPDWKNDPDNHKKALEFYRRIILNPQTSEPGQGQTGQGQTGQRQTGPCKTGPCKASKKEGPENE
jgi:hypothetical protein